MLVKGNKIYRNLQEQVGENQKNIEELQSLIGVGINVKYLVDTIADLSDIEDPEDGSFAAVGMAKPYTLFLFKGNVWIDFGLFPSPGPQGIQGIQGPTGPQGPQGPTGPQGLQGPQGPQGPAGIQGPRGYKGAKGDTGEQGPQGETGEQGPKGDAPNISATASATPSATASASVTKSGTLDNPVFNFLFGLPQGEQGPQGPQGPTGATGPQGPQGPSGTNGTNGTSAGFGTPTASVDANVGTPSVVVTASGPDTAKVFNFAFHNLKGTQGNPGATPSLYSHKIGLYNSDQSHSCEFTLITTKSTAYTLPQLAAIISVMTGIDGAGDFVINFCQSNGTDITIFTYDGDSSPGLATLIQDTVVTF